MKRIQVRLVISFLVIISLLLIQGLFAYWNIRTISSMQSDAYRHNRKISEIQLRLATARLLVFKLLGTMNPQQMDAYSNQFQGERSYLENALVEAFIPEKTVAEAFRQYEDIIKLHYDFRVRTALKRINAESKTHHERIVNQLKSISVIRQRESTDRISNEYEDMLQVTFGLLILALAAAIAMALLLARQLMDRHQAEEALRENEQRFRSLFENMYDGVAIYQPEPDGRDFRFVDLNASGQFISNVKKKDIIGRRITEAFPTVEKMGLLPLLKEVNQTGITAKLPMTMYKDERLLEWVDNTVFKLSTGEIVAVYRDETERYQAEEKVRTLTRDLERRVALRTRQLKETNEELESFVYSVSHDLRAPLRSINGFAEIIDRRYKTMLNDEGQHYLDNIIKASRQMGNLIDDLLTFSRLGRRSIRLESVALDEVVDEVLQTLAGRIRESGAEITLTRPLPVVEGDRTLLNHVLINLVENAIKYASPDRAPRIEINATVENEAVTLTVADNGIGIDPAHHEKIFNIFQRLHNEADYPGTGIGLAAVKKAVQLMNGSVEVDSEPGQGSTFHIVMNEISQSIKKESTHE